MGVAPALTEPLMAEVMLLNRPSVAPMTDPNSLDPPSTMLVLARRPKKSMTASVTRPPAYHIFS